MIRGLDICSSRDIGATSLTRCSTAGHGVTENYYSRFRVIEAKGE